MYVKKKEVEVLKTVLEQWLDKAQDGVIDTSLKAFQCVQNLRLRCDMDDEDHDQSD